jgi:nickel transport protein
MHHTKRILTLMRVTFFYIVTHGRQFFITTWKPRSFELIYKAFAGAIMRFPTIVLTLFIFCLFSQTAFAHKVNVFAWTEGTTVHTESYFSSGNKAQSSTITATDQKTGKVLATGKTDSKGEWSFTLSPEALNAKDPIVITLNAGQGHTGTWTLEAEDFAGEAPKQTTNASAETVCKIPSPAPQKTAPAATITLTEEQLQTLIRSAVHEELIPLNANLSKLNAQILQPKTTMKDIFGGIGYILGLLGLAAFMQYRKKA